MKKGILFFLFVFFAALSIYSQPSSPVLVEPPNLSIVAYAITIDWVNVPNAISYTFQIATDIGFTNVVSGNSTTLSQYTIPEGSLPSNTVYYWRVNASDGILTSP